MAEARILKFSENGAKLKRSPWHYANGRMAFLAHAHKCFRLLSRKARFAFTVIVVFQSVISILDLVGLALIMKIILGFQSDSGGSSSALTGILPVFGGTFSGLDANILLVSIVLIFVVKGLVALYLHSLTIRIMSSETLKLISKLNRAIFENRTNKFKNLTNQDISYTIYNSTEIVFRDTLVPVSIIIADTILLSLIAFNLFISAQVLFFPTTVYFISIFLILRTFEKKSTQSALKIQWEREISGRSLIQETTSSLRELYVSSKLNWMIQRIFQARADGLKAGSVITIGQLRPKYFYEMALFGGIGVIALVSNLSGNSKLIISYLALFTISSSRMIPSLLRIQFYLSTFQKSQEQTGKIFEVIEMVPGLALNKIENYPAINSNQDQITFNPIITIENVSFSYDPEMLSPVIRNLSLELNQGEMLAIVGPSGSGKSTLVDLILSYQKPNSGIVKIFGLDPRESFNHWPGRVAYVPQKVTIFEGSLISNVAIGIDSENDPGSREHAINLLQRVGLSDFIEKLESGIDSKLSELGTSLSGGQIQRIGIARALFTNPEIIVFDESTSSLDSSSEDAIMQFLLSFKGEKTLIFIAHRLSTIKTADRLIYMNEGEIQAQGNFDELQVLIPEFKKQVSYLNVNSIQGEPSDIASN